jgi:hypothetical protein
MAHGKDAGDALTLFMESPAGTPVLYQGLRQASTRLPLREKSRFALRREACAK